MSFKKCKVVMLPINEKALNLTSMVMFNNKLFNCYSSNYSYTDAVFQNLYILSDEEIKEGDWMYYKYFGEDIICKYDTMGGQNTNVNEYKDFYKKNNSNNRPGLNQR